MTRTERATADLVFEPKGLESNDKATSIGEDMREEAYDFGIPLKNHTITKVLDDVILISEIVPDEMGDDGFVQTEGGIILTKEAFEGTQNSGVYKVYLVEKVGINVKEIKVGDKIVQSKKSGLEVEFEGRSFIMSREANVMFVVEENTPEG